MVSNFSCNFSQLPELIIRPFYLAQQIKGTCLAVRTPIVGRYARPWPQLANSLYLKKWSREISLSKTSKAWILLAVHHQHPNELIRHQQSNSSDRGSRQLSKEDFLSTLELSISLWNLHSPSSLPLTESLYDEVIPSFEELTSVDQTNNRFISHSCKYLFHACHLLQNNAIGSQFSKVSLEIWISFWSKKDMKYRQPIPRKEKKKALPKKLRDETYLVAYLACWLCTFVLTNDDVGSICPIAFKIANMMVIGRKVILGIHVLASIYKGLNKVSNSPRPTCANYYFSVHFIYAWLAYYFKTHYSVPQDIHSPRMTQFSNEGGNLLFVDDGKAKEHEQDYFMFFCYFVIAPYSLYRFSRQFGSRINNRKIASRPFEVSGIDRHWKWPKRYPKTSKQVDTDGDKTGSNPIEVFAKRVIS
ncbi:hypothetical protein CDL12_08733 [Handroanthus impetiginosus]|uniref:Aminotransferase-like plant mobile domain-containing protein n=1 Tax=Handroanthus impetiginosus TaxID=429701 RepID=A0A2G9HM40_9LAMI|nr:hypothetical protein CDL12_08733 [Handroanthus impetiginosus]